MPKLTSPFFLQLFVGGLSLYHKHRGIVSSGFVFLFWFSLTLLAIPQFRHEIRHFERRPETTIGTDNLSWDDYVFISNMIYFPLVAIQLIAHCFADKKPLHSTYVNVKTDYPSPEPYAGFVKRIFFFWFDPFAWTGYRKSLESSDIWDINPDDTSTELVPPFDKHWKKNVAKKEKADLRKTKGKGKDVAAGPKSTRGSIVPVLFLSYGVPFYYGGLMKLIVDLLSFANPQILRYTS